jgi:solute carrier family 39 (zinc transporter), member 1/2/3
MDSVGVAKIVSIVVLAVVSIVCGMIPVLISKKMNWKSETSMSNTSKSWLSGLLCFGGGVLMATSLIHLLPEVHEGFGALKESGEMETSLPIGEIIICAGFFLVYFIEETVHFFADRHAHSQVDVSIHRSVGVRECSVSREGHPTPPCGSEEAECTKDSICKLECQVREFCRDVEAANEDKRPSYDSGEQLVTKVPEKIVKESKSVEKKKPSSHEGHHHHHGLTAGDGHSILPAIRGLLVVIGLSIHEVFEGLALGLETTEGDVWQLLAAIGAHKFVIAFCVGLDMTVNGVRLCLHVTYMLVFGLITSLGKN